MNNPQYIEYLNTFGAEIDVSSQPRKEIDALFKEHTTKENEFEILEGLFKQKYYQCCDLIKQFLLDGAETERTRIINSIEKLRNKDFF